MDIIKVKLYITKGITNKNMGITPDQEIGYLYHAENDYKELEHCAVKVGANPSWMQNKLNGLAFYYLWGSPLMKAKIIYKVVSADIASADKSKYDNKVKNYQAAILNAEYKGVDKQNLILNNLGYTHFLSRSAGRGRKRKSPVEVELYRLCGGGWHIEKHTKFDVMTEIMDGAMLQSVTPGDDLKWYAKRYCDCKGGKCAGIV